MKILIYIAYLVLWTVTLFTMDVDVYYETVDYKGTKETLRIKLPGWLFKNKN